MIPAEFVNLFLQIPLVGLVVWVVLYLNREARNERDAWLADLRELQRSWRDAISAWRAEAREDSHLLEAALNRNTEALAILARQGSKDA